MDHFYLRHLPHEIPDGVPFFITWNLKGALPDEALQRFLGERERLELQPPRVGESLRDRRIRESKILFAMTDRFLDTSLTGPMDLKEPAAAKIVESSIVFGVPERYDLYAWCVMGNHVHVLLKPIWDLVAIMKSLKGFTAYEINGLTQTRGRTLWQDESYDHWVRDEEELARIIHYIENNPVAAGLCGRPEDWPWSSARFRHLVAPGQLFTAIVLKTLLGEGPSG